VDDQDREQRGRDAELTEEECQREAHADTGDEERRKDDEQDEARHFKLANGHGSEKAEDGRHDADD
jgi:hypothetical protein